VPAARDSSARARRGGAIVALLVLSSLGASARAEADSPPDARPFETVVTVPPPAAAPRADGLASGSVVSPEDSPRAHDDVGTLMLQVPGVTTARTGGLGSFTTLSLRGSNPDQVRVYIDGVPVAIAEGGGVDLSTLPLGDVERVEVYRGQAPLAFGESALGGILSITTRTPGAPSLGARAGAGSFGTYFGDVAAGGRAGRLRLYLGVHGLSSKGDYPYPNDNGTPLNPADDRVEPRQNSDVDQADGTFRAALALRGRRLLSLGVIAFGRDQGLPGPNLAQTRFVRFATARALTYLRYESRDDLGPGGRLSAQLFFSAERDHYTDPGEISAGVSNTYDTEWQHDSYGHARPLNLGSARIFGVEEELRVAVGPWGRFVGQGTFLDARDESDNTAHHGRQLPLRPRWQAYARPELVHLPLRRGGDGGVGPLELAAFVDAALSRAATTTRRTCSRCRRGCSRARASASRRRASGCA
jgi:iron complex outermembrane receptor protein